MDVLLRVGDDEIGGNVLRVGPSLDQVFDGLCQLGGINFAAGLFLPFVRSAFKTQVKGFKTGLHHEAGYFGRYKAGVERIRGMEFNRAPAADHFLQKRQEELFLFEEQRIVVQHRSSSA